MSPNFYHILHVLSVLTLTGYTFYAFAAPAPETRRKVLMITGIASLLILVSGFGLKEKLGYAFATWFYVKIAAWLAFSALAGIAYRRREKIALLTVLAFVILFVAVYAVYVKPV